MGIWNILHNVEIIRQFLIDLSGSLKCYTSSLFTTSMFSPHHSSLTVSYLRDFWKMVCSSLAGHLTFLFIMSKIITHFVFVVVVILKQTLFLLVVLGLQGKKMSRKYRWSISLYLHIQFTQLITSYISDTCVKIDELMLIPYYQLRCIVYIQFHSEVYTQF